MTISHHSAEMSDLSIKLIHEQQKCERQININGQLDDQLRDLEKELKVEHFL